MFIFLLSFEFFVYFGLKSFFLHVQRFSPVCGLTCHIFNSVFHRAQLFNLNEMQLINCFFWWWRVFRSQCVQIVSSLKTGLVSSQLFKSSNKNQKSLISLWIFIGCPPSQKWIYFYNNTENKAWSFLYYFILTAETYYHNLVA